MGWRPQGQSRRLIFALTDGDYHYALDGKVILFPTTVNLDTNRMSIIISEMFLFQGLNCMQETVLEEKKIRGVLISGVSLERGQLC